MDGFSLNPIKAEIEDEQSAKLPKLRPEEREFTSEFRKVYKIGKRIGKGAYATVYSGSHIETGT